MEQVLIDIKNAFKKNKVPGTFLQLIALLLIFTYFKIEGVKQFWIQVQEIKLKYGFYYSFFATAFIGGLLPFILKQSLKDKYASPLLVSIFVFVFWGYKGIEVDVLYKLQAFIFGNNADILTVLKKTLVDQLIYAPTIGTVTVILSYKWLDQNFQIKDMLKGNWYRREIFPSLVANWMIWTPSVFIIYLFPLPLQLPMFNLVLFFWVLMVMLLVKPKKDVPGTNNL
ncbi:MAG: Mpv17/PMP22 family protein [Spirochaetes bacterium]|nr:Mpv17/PMP22 family protein [Spirochaetota bacterium]